MVIGPHSARVLTAQLNKPKVAKSGPGQWSHISCLPLAILTVSHWHVLGSEGTTGRMVYRLGSTARGWASQYAARQYTIMLGSTVVSVTTWITISH